MALPPVDTPTWVRLAPPRYDEATELPAVSSDERLAAFWKMHGLAGEQDTINTYLGTRSVQDLDYVNANDMRTIAFRTWADHTITVVAKNRLVRAIETYTSPAANYCTENVI